MHTRINLAVWGGGLKGTIIFTPVFKTNCLQGFSVSLSIISVTSSIKENTYTNLSSKNIFPNDRVGHTLTRFVYRSNTMLGSNLDVRDLQWSTKNKHAEIEKKNLYNTRHFCSFVEISVKDMLWSTMKITIKTYLHLNC